MAEKIFIWRGPPTAIDLWPPAGLAPTSGADGRNAPAAPILSAIVSPGDPLPAEVDADHPQIKGWLAFGLIEQASAVSANEPDAAQSDAGQPDAGTSDPAVE